MTAGAHAQGRARRTRFVAAGAVGATVLGLVVVVAQPASAAPPAFGSVTNVANTGTGTYAVAVGDLNRDGTQDIVSAELTNGVSVALGTGGRAFAASVDYPAPSSSGSPLITSVVVADVTGDGIPDVVATNAGDNEVDVWPGNGDGTLGTPSELQLNSRPGCGLSSSNPCVAAYPAQVVVADLNGDGIADIATADTNTDNVSLLLGTGAGAFADAVQLPLGNGAQPTSIAVSDVNGDGHADLVAGGGTGAITVLTGDGTGAFGTPSTYPSGLTQVAALQVADVNGDGIPDAIATDNGFAGQVAVLLGSASGTFGAGTLFDAGPNPSGLAVADLDHDGHADLAIADNGSDQVLVLDGDGSGSFTSQSTFELNGGSGPQPLAVADVDGDGRPDVVTGNLSSPGSDVSVLFNSSPIASTTALSADSSTSTAGEQVTYTATVTGAYGSGTPSGTVDFTDGGTDISGCAAQPVTSGTATCAVTYTATSQHTMLASYSGDSTFATSTSTTLGHSVTPGELATLTVAPASATIVAGGTQAFTAEGSDSYGNDLGDVTSATSFTLAPTSAGATTDASCTGATCTAATVGTYEVTASDGAATGTATLGVTAAPVSSLTLSPANDTITAGDSDNYTASGTDAYGNSTGDLTSAATFTITSVTGGSANGASCAAANCTATAAGTYRIDASVTTPSGTATGSAGLTVTAGALASVTLSPASATVKTGTSKHYTATGADSYRNSLGNVTSATTFTIDGAGTCSGSGCSSTQAGSYTVTGTDGSVSGTATLTVTAPHAAAPTVTAITPTSGPTAGSTTVTITGTGFTTATAVRFGSKAATSFTITSDTQIQAVSSAQAAGVVDVTVTGPGGRSTTGAADRFTFQAPPPTVTSVSPVSGPASGGTTVTVKGKNFDASSTVSFGSTPSTDVTVVSSTRLQAVAPPLTPGTYDVQVTTSRGTSTVVKGDRYVAKAPVPAVSAITPATGTTAGGTAVDITGSGFTNATAVRFGTTSGRSVSVVSNSEIHVVSPAHGAGAVNISVTTSGGTSASGTASTYTFVTPPPTVTSLTPHSGPTTGGTTVTVNGTTFTGATQVLFGGVAATSVTIVSSTKITATSPAQAAGSYDVTVTTPAGSSSTSSADTFRFVLPKPTATAASPTTGPKAGGTTVTITGSGFTGATAVKFGSAAATSVTVTSDGQLTAVSPKHSTGAVAVAITVTAPGGTTVKSNAPQFTYT